MTQRVSVIIPAYQAAERIAQALDSVTAQTYPHWEVIVVEDGTDDGTAAIVADFAKTWGADKFRYHRQGTNQGVSSTRNTALDLAKGDYIALLDHDDRWLPHHLETALRFLDCEKADLFYAQAEFFEDGTDRHLGLCGPTPEDLAHFPGSLLGKSFIPVCTVVMRQQVCQTLSGFNPQLQAAEDLDFWLRAIAAGYRFAYDPAMHGGYRQNNPTAATAQKADILEWHTRVLRQHYTLPTVSRRLSQQVTAKMHLGVARRNFQADPQKSWQFLLWAGRHVPAGVFAALGAALVPGQKATANISPKG